MRVAVVSRRLPPVVIRHGPDVQLLGDTVLVRGRAAADGLRLLRAGYQLLDQQSARDGIAPPPHLLQLLAAFEDAAGHGTERAADMTGHLDVRRSATSASSSAGGCWVGVEEAAGLLGVSERQARRRVELAGGHKTRKGWRIERDALLAHREVREAG